MADSLSPTRIQEWRDRHYNATVVDLRLIHDELMIIRIRPDEPFPQFSGGQYTVIGLGNWEPRTSDTQAEQLSEKELKKVVKRAYSISCPVLANGKLVAAHDMDYLEFYIALVRVADRKPPALTPRLFALNSGDRLFLGGKITGHYTLEQVADDDDVILLATGTGEAPHNAMLAELLQREHRGKIVSAVCVRYRSDLAYLDTHKQVVADNPTYAYCPMTTREPENLDDAHPDYVGKQYLQKFITSGELEDALGHPLNPAKTHVFLCGNPAMIGIPEINDGQRVYPQPTGVIEILEQRGLQADETGEPGNIHFEKYW
ncbi:Ferredoxin--NADP reductase [Symmachiella macrocystis]|uniref:ferredoxin--NADP(+) reductase n=1 Tax=Symmachiella macrocystis TaxID=2527985 RepID=A0A5C6BFF1_9PLAN|nr:ferredoxin--NADP reductase [Symmachiella macrocystis]TWU09204.1 Ferredoxin--NADP reductase [Symmachiella macrocystis]